MAFGAVLQHTQHNIGMYELVFASDKIFRYLLFLEIEQKTVVNIFFFTKSHRFFALI